MKNIHDAFIMLTAFAMIVFSSCDTRIDSDLDTALEQDNVFTDEESVYTMPVADAGDNISMALGQTVTLDGSGSYDDDGDVLTFEWRVVEKPSGSTATLSDAYDESPTFTADTAGDYDIELAVDDGVEISTDVITVSIDDEARSDREDESEDSDSLDTCFISLLSING